MRTAKLKLWYWLIVGCAFAHLSLSEAIGDQSTVNATIADVPLLVAAPRNITEHTPVIIMYHGFGPPNTPELLAQALPPIPNAITVYASLPLVGKRMPAGGVEELLKRQNNDYVGQLLYPSMLVAARELPRIIEGLSKTYGLSKSSPIVLFGFSAGGAAALLSLTESNVHPCAVIVVNAPLSIAQAVDAYERQSKNVYRWTEEAKEASKHYDIENTAERIARLNPKTAFLILQSERDAGPTVQAAQSAAAALKRAASRYRREPDISAKQLSDADHSVFGGSESATTQRTVIDWIEQHASSRPSLKQTRSKPSN